MSWFKVPNSSSVFFLETLKSAFPGLVLFSRSLCLFMMTRISACSIWEGRGWGRGWHWCCPENWAPLRTDPLTKVSKRSSCGVREQKAAQLQLKSQVRDLFEELELVKGKKKAWGKSQPHIRYLTLWWEEAGIQSRGSFLTKRNRAYLS